MMDKKSLRPVQVNFMGKTQRGFFHRFIYQSDRYYSITLAIIELEDGKLRTFEPEFIQFLDREKNKKFPPLKGESEEI